MKLLNMISLVCAFLLFQKMVQAQSDEEYSVRIYVNIVYEDMSQVDGALIKVYDKNRNYLCERFSDMRIFLRMDRHGQGAFHHEYRC